ncbi:MAG: hypothetical protein AAFU85_02180 [Planctomycetota bacterium]
MSEEDFEVLVTECISPPTAPLARRADRVEGFLASRVLAVLRGEKEPEGTAEEIWVKVIRQEAARRRKASAA